MKKIYLLFIFSLIGFYSYSQHDQSNVGRFNAIDSTRKSLYKDSIGLSEGVIRQLFELRNYFYKQSAVIASDNTISEEIRTNYSIELRKSYLISIEKLLGKENYTRYLAFIQRRLDSTGQTLKPLTVE